MSFNTDDVSQDELDNINEMMADAIYEEERERLAGFSEFTEMETEIVVPVIHSEDADKLAKEFFELSKEIPDAEEDT